GGPWHDFLPRQDVPREIPRWHILSPARVLEPHDADRRSRTIHEPERRRQGAGNGDLRRWMAGAGRIHGAAGRCRHAARWVAAGIRRLRGSHLSHFLRRPALNQVRVKKADPKGSAFSCKRLSAAYFTTTLPVMMAQWPGKEQKKA